MRSLDEVVNSGMSVGISRLMKRRWQALTGQLWGGGESENFFSDGSIVEASIVNPTPHRPRLDGTMLRGASCQRAPSG